MYKRQTSDKEDDVTLDALEDIQAPIDNPEVITLKKTFDADELKFDTRTIEMCLAHKTKEVLGTAYDRAKRLDDRKRFYQSWSDFLIDCKKQYQKTRIKRVK